MSTVADRTRAAMDAVTSQVDSAPPLPLPPPLAWAPPGSRRRWRALGPRRRWGAWLAPLAAAAAVIAFAVSLVAVRGTPGGYTLVPAISRAGAAVSFPDYYLTFNQPVSDETIPVGLELRSTLTGKTLSTLQPPRGLSFAGITGAADDRTFVAAAHRDPYGAFNSGGRSRTWYLVRVTGTGSRVSLRMTKLPVPATPVGTEILAIALSPDGTKLAVGTAPWTDNAANAKQALRVYSVATGAVLRTWTTPPGPANWAIMSGGGGGADPNTGVAWAGNHALAFGGTQKGYGPAYTIRVLDISRPDGDLLGSSRPATSVPTAFGGSGQKTPFGCDPSWRVNVLITGDGTSFVCGGYGVSSAHLPTTLCVPGTAWNTVAFAGFSLATGERTYLSGYRTTCQGLAVVAYAVWVNATGSKVIGWMHVANSIPGKFGVFSNGSFRPLPIPVPGNWYQWDDGSLLYQVAW
jgi:hypothetical protein